MKRRQFNKILTSTSSGIILSSAYSCVNLEPKKLNGISLAQWSLHKMIKIDKTLNPIDFAQKAKELGVKPYILSDAIEGRAADIGIMHASLAKFRQDQNAIFQRPAVILSGGETTVEILDKSGRGGRNTEFLLSFALSIENESNITALAADTDGIDGSENNAGAFCDGNTVIKMREKGLDPRMHLVNHDAWTAFDAVNELFISGPTGTNVNDFRAILLR